MNNPTTSTEQMLAAASNGVSSTLSGTVSGRGPEDSLIDRGFFSVILSLYVSEQ